MTFALQLETCGERVEDAKVAGLTVGRLKAIIGGARFGADWQALE